MIDDFIFSVNAVFPIFVIIALGYYLRRKEFLSPRAIGDMNRIIFSFALPALLFRNIYHADFFTLFDIRLFLWISGSTFAVFILTWIIAELYLRKRPELIGAFVQAAFRSNYSFVGIPLVANMMGEAEAGIAALAAAFIVTYNNVLTVIVLTAKDSKSSGFNLTLFKGILEGIYKTPSIIAIAVVIPINLLGISIPVVARESISYMAVLCTPLALLAIGGSIQISEFRGYVKPAIVASALKTAILPLVFVSISVWLGFRGEELAVLFVMLASPSAIICYVMAVRMNGNGPISSAIILITTICSSVTLTLGIYIMRMLDLI